MSDAEFRAIDPHRRQSRPHAMPIRILLGGLENDPVGQMDGRSKVLCSGVPMGLYCADYLGRRIGLGVEAVFHDCFNGHGAGYFTVGFAPHAVGKHEEIQRLNDLVAIFVVCAHATHIAHAATRDSHTNSHRRPEITRLPALVPGNSVLTLTEPQGRRKALNPTDYSLFRHMRGGSDACSLVYGRSPVLGAHWGCQPYELSLYFRSARSALPLRRIALFLWLESKNRRLNPSREPETRHSARRRPPVTLKN